MADDAIETKKDVDAFDPQPVTTLRVYVRDAQGFVTRDAQNAPVLLASFPVYSMLDFPFAIATKLTRLELDLAGKTLAEQGELVQERLRMVCPALTDEGMAACTPEEALTAWRKALGPRPPVAGQDNGAAALAPSSPSPVSPSPVGPTLTPGA